ncbi:MAG: 4-hydroxy-tetrahydrodipicolinate reductase [Clostridiales bacterium]|nr:4-hydroxy-tetrahydrodipicolinate reductase [Clostridiales bacterium]
MAETRIILCGCLGKMGQNVRNEVKKTAGFVITAGVDIAEAEDTGFPVYTSFDDIKEEADVIIDFSHYTMLEKVLAYAEKKNLPAVLCTTGYTAEQKALISKKSEELPLFYSANMSLGVNLQIKLAQLAHKFFGDSADIEIVEKHHNRKLDAPSGTALAIADAINEDNSFDYVYDRQSRHQKRDKKEIGISAVRGGNIVGEHEVFFICENEIIEIKHTAQSREVFAAGALRAAAFMKGKAAGLYNMNSILES